MKSQLMLRLQVVKVPQPKEPLLPRVRQQKVLSLSRKPFLKRRKKRISESYQNLTSMSIMRSETSSSTLRVIVLFTSPVTTSNFKPAREVRKKRSCLLSKEPKTERQPKSTLKLKGKLATKTRISERKPSKKFSLRWSRVEVSSRIGCPR